MSEADHSTRVAKLIRLLDSSNEPEAQSAFRKLRAYCADNRYQLTSLPIGPTRPHIELTLARTDDSTHRTIKIFEDQQTETQKYCAFLERQVEELTKRLAEAQARPPRRKRKKATAS